LQTVPCARLARQAWLRPIRAFAGVTSQEAGSSTVRGGNEVPSAYAHASERGSAKAMLAGNLAQGHGLQDSGSQRGKAVQRCDIIWNGAIPPSPRKAEVLSVYRQAKVLKARPLRKTTQRCVAIISYDEKARHPGHRHHRAGLSPSRETCDFAREHEYKRHGTVSLLAGIDLLTARRTLLSGIGIAARIIGIFRPARRAYPTHTAIKKWILDNHSRTSRRGTKAWMRGQPKHPL